VWGDEVGAGLWMFLARIGRFWRSRNDSSDKVTATIQLLPLQEGARTLDDSVRPPGIGAGRAYFPAFDGIRAVAILAVFINHYSVLSYGHLGVSVFLVLSGFLITGVLLRSRDQVDRWKTFYMRRTLRIFPVYWGFWLVVVCLTGVLHVMWNRGNLLYVPYAGNMIWSFYGGRWGAPEAMVHVGFAPDAAGIARHWIYVGHFWTLAVEEQFYLFWPMLVLWPKRVENVLRLCVGTIVLVTLAKVAFAFVSTGFPSQVVRITLLRCDEFAFGGVVAALVCLGKFHRLVRWSNWLVAVGCVTLVGTCMVNSLMGSELSGARWDFLVNLPVTDVLAVGLILAGMAPQSIVARGLSWRPLVRLGQISYGFYVFHDIGHPLIRDFVERQFLGGSQVLRDAMTALIAFGIALGLAVLSFRYLETPFLRLKDRWTAKIVVLRPVILEVPEAVVVL